jgi:hypothetical protein
MNVKKGYDEEVVEELLAQCNTERPSAPEPGIHCDQAVADYVSNSH